MITPDRSSSRDSRFAVWIGTTLTLFIAAVAIGFVWLPSAQAGASGLDLWGAICSAVGLPNRNARIPVTVTGQPASSIAWTPETRLLLAQGNAAHGAALATTCNNCHGSAGVSDDAIFPNLAGQSVDAIYKQMEDFKTGKRDAALMGVYVNALSSQDLRDLAAYFAGFPSAFTHTSPEAGSVDSPARRLVEVGDPLRGIASCAACHGPMGVTPGAPELRGQQRAYFEEQLQALATGRRHNDISEQMRTVARQLTPQEISQLAAYYANLSATHPPPVGK